MLLLSYGITKSGSTLAFELAKGLLSSAGQPQKRLPDGPVEVGHPVNFQPFITVAKVEALLEAIPKDQIVAVKTHSSLDAHTFAFLDAQAAAGNLAVHAVCRDPRDICLSMLDAGKWAREHQRKEFSEFVTLDDAVKACRAQFVQFRKWGAITGALRIRYGDLVSAPRTVADRINGQLGIAGSFESAYKYAFEEAFTQKNKAVLDRYLSEMDAEAAERVAASMPAIMKNAILRDNPKWFTSMRETLLSN